MESGVFLARPERVEALAARLGGDVDAACRASVVERLASPIAEVRTAAEALMVVAHSRYLAAARAGGGVVLCSPELSSRLPAERRWIHRHPLWVMAVLLTEAESARSTPAVSELVGDVQIAEGAVVHAGVKAGSGCRIGEGAVIFAGVVLGERVAIGANSVIGRPGFGFTHAPDGGLTRIPQLGGVRIEDDVEIGPLCSVDAGTLAPTRIGQGSKLDAQVHVGHNVDIGAGCLIAAQVGFAGSSRLGAGSVVGGQAGVADHAVIGEGVRIAAKSGVIGDVPAGSVVAGFPAVPRMRWLRGMARLLATGRGLNR